MADGLIEVTVDISDVLDGFQTLDGELNYMGRRLIDRVVGRVERQAKAILMTIYDTALLEAGSNFPRQYAEHLREGLSRLAMVVEPYDTEISVSFEDIEELGSWDDIFEAVHYNAILNEEFDFANPPLSEIGDGTDALYGPAKENGEDNRQDFWDALVVGSPYTAYFGTARIPHTFSTEGAYDDTLNARVSFWGDRYPEWLILDEGLDGVPGSRPTHFVSLVGPAIEEFVLSLLEQNTPTVYDEAVAVWDDKTKRYRGPTGKFTKGPAR